MILFVPVVLGLAVNPVAADTTKMPWEENRPIVKVKRELYRASPAKGQSAWVGVRYVDGGLLREETHTEMAQSDTPTKPRYRRSNDNGRTWSEFKPKPEVVTHPGGVRVYWGDGAHYYDARYKATVGIWLRQPYIRGQHHNHCFARTSFDLGDTWGPAQLLRYEEGDDYDPDDPFKPSYLMHNQAYTGSNTIRLSNGDLLHCVAHANAKGDPMNDERAWRMGSLCFIGKWDSAKKDYKWTAGKRVEISPEKSCRGLMEPSVAELNDGRVLVIWRCSSTNTTPGCKFVSTSSDGGRTLSEVKELTYDDGSRFYSPSSFHQLLRHSRTKKLYWVANISATIPHGNSPRYPLIIAEVDEPTATIRRDTVTLIDTRGKDDSSKLQLSNFSVFENRETHDIEIFLTRLGADPNDFWGSDAYKYTLTPVEKP